MAEKILSRIEKWELTYTHSMGETASHFFHEIRNHRRLVGRLAPKAGRVLMPPRAFSDIDFEETTDWVPVANEGRIETFTIVCQQFPGMPAPPYAIGFVLLDGADTALGGFIRGVDLTEPRAAAEKLKIGTRVQVKYRDKPEGNVLDFWFEPA